MKLSVIIATQNRKDQLEHCLLNLPEQTLRPLEVIVIDNGSEEETRIFFQNFEYDNNDVVLKKILFDKNMGLPYARNRGAEQAEGNIIVWMDNDNYFNDSEALLKIYNEFEKDEKLQLLTYPIHEFLPNGEERYNIPRPHTFYKFEKEFETAYFIGCGIAMRRDMFLNYGMFDESLIYQLEEIEFSYKIANDRLKIKYVPHIEIQHEPQHSKFHNSTYYYLHTRNRLWIVLKYLPQPYLTVHISLWLTKLFMKSMRDGKVSSFFKGVIAGFSNSRTIYKARKKAKLSRTSVKWLQQRFGRVWY